MSAELKKSNVWSRESADIMTQICMGSAQSVYFCPTELKDNCYYGKLTHGKCITDMLLDMEYAIRKFFPCLL